MTIWITSGDRPSNGRLALQKAGGFRRFNPAKMKPGDHLINWGVSAPGTGWSNVLNQPKAVAIAANKLYFFQKIGDVSVVPWTTDKTVAQEWLDNKKTVVVRNKLTGHSGEGIVIIEPGEELPAAPLYTQYINKTHEYRVHVVGGSVVDVQRKIRDPKQEPLTWKVRSHANGFIFVRNNVVLPSQVAELAVAAAVACGLDFGAVDLILDKHGNAYVLEINTAPGLEGATVDSYCTALKALINGH